MSPSKRKGEVVFSIVIPAYNAAAHIGRALSSVRRQDWGERALEVVVVDDGSQDRLLEAVSSVPIQGTLTLVHQENRGACAARNHGAEVATGNYLVFLDSDDGLDPSWLKRFSEASAGDPPTIHCGTRIIRPGSDDQPLLTHPTSLGPAFSDLPGPLLPGSYAIRAELFHELEGFDERARYGEHHELGLRLGRLLKERCSTPSAVIDQVLLTKHHDRSPARVSHYDESRFEGAEFTLSTHAELLARDTRVLSNLHGVAGVAAARLGRWTSARQHFLESLANHPLTPKYWARLGLALTPVVRNLYWSRNHRTTDDV